MLAISERKSYSGINSIPEVCGARNFNCWSTEGGDREKQEGFLHFRMLFFFLH